MNEDIKDKLNELKDLIKKLSKESDKIIYEVTEDLEKEEENYINNFLEYPNHPFCLFHVYSNEDGCTLNEYTYYKTEKEYRYYILKNIDDAEYIGVYRKVHPKKAIKIESYEKIITVDKDEWYEENYDEEGRFKDDECK